MYFYLLVLVLRLTNVNPISAQRKVLGSFLSLRPRWNSLPSTGDFVVGNSSDGGRQWLSNHILMVSVLTEKCTVSPTGCSKFSIENCTHSCRDGNSFVCLCDRLFVLYFYNMLIGIYRDVWSVGVSPCCILRKCKEVFNRNT